MHIGLSDTYRLQLVHFYQALAGKEEKTCHVRYSVQIHFISIGWKFDLSLKLLHTLGISSVTCYKKMSVCQF